MVHHVTGIYWILVQIVRNSLKMQWSEIIFEENPIPNKMRNLTNNNSCLEKTQSKVSTNVQNCYIRGLKLMGMGVTGLKYFRSDPRKTWIPQWSQLFWDKIDGVWETLAQIFHWILDPIVIPAIVSASVQNCSI